MKPVKTILIADDEEHVCSDLRYIINQDPRVRIIKICSSGDEALDSICSLKPDIVFLDINMPRFNGIQVGNYLRNIKKPPYLVYITAYSEFAIEAFKVGAKGYLLKPFAEEEVGEQINRALECLITEPIQGQDSGKNVSLQERNQRIGIEVEGRYQLLDQHDILVAFAQSRAVFLQTRDKTYMTRFSLVELEARLQKEIFMRCHRNFLVNLDHIKEVIPWFHSTFMLILDDDNTRVAVSRAHIPKFKEVFHL